MEIQHIDAERLAFLLSRPEGHFIDFKAREITPAKLSQSIAAFGNADGGEIFVGISEVGGTFKWRGFDKLEDINPIFQIIEKDFTQIDAVRTDLLTGQGVSGVVLKIEVIKSAHLFRSTDGAVFKRVNAQNIKLIDDTKIRQIELEKGIHSFEDNTVNSSINDTTNSTAILEFMLSVVPMSEPQAWLEKEKLIVHGKNTVAGELLFSDLPQSGLPQAVVKLYRYKTSDMEGARETLDGVPETIEGNLYSVIFRAIDRTVEVAESIPILSTEHGFERIAYPKEAIHEVICNALIHRDYSIADYVHVRIFDNRIEVQSPGRLPGHITEKNILRERFIRNKKITRILNKYKIPPNQDVGEGLNTAFTAMRKLQLKEPAIRQLDSAVLVILRHEKLASLEEMIANFLKQNNTITNSRAREVFGEASESKVRKAFQAMREAGLLEVVPGTRGKGTAYQLTSKGRQAGIRG